MCVCVCVWVKPPVHTQTCTHTVAPHPVYHCRYLLPSIFFKGHFHLTVTFPSRLSHCSSAGRFFFYSNDNLTMLCCSWWWNNWHLMSKSGRRVWKLFSNPKRTVPRFFFFSLYLLQAVYLKSHHFVNPDALLSRLPHRLWLLFINVWY